MRLAALCALALVLPLGAQDGGQPDRYPQIRAIIREAEVDAAGVPMLPDRSRPEEWAGRLYARAGYLDDATRAYGKTGDVQIILLRARVIYGELPDVDKGLESITNLNHKASSMLAVGEILWRMGNTGAARRYLDNARQVALRIPGPEERKHFLSAIDRELKYAAEPPPYLITATPQPAKKFDLQDSAIPLFPITTDGFRDLDSREVASRAEANAVFMQTLYERMAAGDRDGLLRLSNGAATPFQKAIGIASIEHIAIQASQPQAAKEIAMTMPESDVDCILAKAEALSAAGAAWLRAQDSDKAGPDFDAAASLVKSAKELPMGKVTVATSIAAAEFKGGMTASSGITFKLAREFALELPVRPEAGPRAPGNSSGVHYRDEGYNRILSTAIRAHNVGLAREMAELWKAEGGSSDVPVVNAWLNADQPDEAIAFARKIDDSPSKIRALLNIAQTLLDRAGAPVF